MCIGGCPGPSAFLLKEWSGVVFHERGYIRGIPSTCGVGVMGTH